MKFLIGMIHAIFQHSWPNKVIYRRAMLYCVSRVPQSNSKSWRRLNMPGPQKQIQKFRSVMADTFPFQPRISMFQQITPLWTSSIQRWCIRIRKRINKFWKLHREVQQPWQKGYLQDGFKVESETVPQGELSTWGACDKTTTFWGPLLVHRGIKWKKSESMQVQILKHDVKCEY